jgi:glycosyltransferase involved in cell wall biosynthesis
MKNIFFSIVIPTYNSQETIIKCIGSCINQSLQGIEIIIVDDYSNDNTIKVIEKYIDKNKIENIKIKRLETNRGASVARNIGIKMAQGEYIALLDSDDYFHPSKLKVIREVLLSNLNIDLLGHNYYTESEEKYKIPEFNIQNMKLKRITFASLLVRNFAVTPSIVFKRSINIYFNEGMRYTEDHEFFLRVCYNNYRIYYLDVKLVGLNRDLLSAGGQSANNLKMRLGEIGMYLDLYKLNYLYIFLSPFLVAFSILKHILSILKKFRNKNATN